MKILEKDFSIDNDKYINSKCLIYLNPEENSENKEKIKLYKKKKIIHINNQKIILTLLTKQALYMYLTKMQFL